MSPMRPAFAIALALGGCPKPRAPVEALPAPVVVPPAPAEPATPRPDPADLALTFVPGSTRKVEQLVGDVDRETGEPVRSRTESRWGIVGTDLGASFEHDGRAWFLFGDTIGLKRFGDAIASTTATRGDEGVRLEFLEDDDGGWLRVRPPGVSMGPFEVPAAGISIDGRAYVVVKTRQGGEADDAGSVVTRFDPERGRFTFLRDWSRLPGGRFVKMSLRLEPEPVPGLPPGGPFVLAWGSGVLRESDAYLAIVPARSFDTGEGTLYYAGADVQGPRWSEEEADAVPVVAHPTIGDLSVTWVEELGVWLMVYDSRDPRGVLLRWSALPWGPWSEPQRIFLKDEGLRRFIHDPRADDGLAGPVIGAGKEDPAGEHGGAYAPYVVERFTRVEGDRLVFFYVLSTWNPYVVVLMRSELAIASR